MGNTVSANQYICSLDKMDLYIIYNCHFDFITNIFQVYN